MNRYEQLLKELPENPKAWLITGVAGFIGSNLLETLLKLEQKVVGLDNFATGHRRNIEEVKSLVTAEQWARFHFIEGDIRDFSDCQKACTGIDYVLHQAALGSVPRSISDPLTSNATNVDGFLNMLVAGRDADVASFTYAASSSTYGDHPSLPKVEHIIGQPLSPYAVTKLVNELYAAVFKKNYGFQSIGLRYFNVFGPRQDPRGSYAAVIPRWIAAMIEGEGVFINGDGETSRDFCYVENVIQANILAATRPPCDAESEVYNVALGDRTKLLDLFLLIQATLGEAGVTYKKKPIHKPFRDGDVRHSQADINKIKEVLGFKPMKKVAEGIDKTVQWYLQAGGVSRGKNEAEK